MSAPVSGSSGGSVLPASGASHRRSRASLFGWTLAIYAGVLCAALWAFVVIHVRSDYRSALEREEDHLVSISSALEIHVESLLDDGLGSARSAVDVLQSAGGVAGATNDEISRMLVHLLRGNDLVQALFLVSPGRFVLSGRAGERQSGTAPPSWLAPALSSPGMKLWIGRPIPDPGMPALTVVPIAQRVPDTGLANLWAGALLAFSRLAPAYEQAEPGTSVAVHTRDGLVLAMIPAALFPGAAGRSIAASLAFQRAVRGPPRGIVEGPSLLTHRPLLVAYDSVPRYPIVTSAAVETKQALGPWAARRRLAFSLAGFVTLLLVAMTWVLDRLILALGRNESHYRALFDNAAFGAVVLDGERIVEANRTSAAMFGASGPQELVGRTLGSLCASGIADRGGSSDIEWTCRRLDAAETFTAAVHFSSLESSGRSLGLAIIQDISQQKRLDEEREQVLSELHELAGELVSAQDDERRRVGRELHDTTGQTLAALELTLNRLRDLSGMLAESARTVLDECIDLARRCSAEIRTASYLLHPPLLEEVGLMGALRWFADGLRDRGSLSIDLQLPKRFDRLPREQELALFRVAQEALTNVHRHSQTRSATVRLRGDETVVLEIEDTGRGFEVETEGRGSATGGAVAVLGVGLAGMRERMRQLGGTLTVRSGPGGTCVRATLERESRSAERRRDRASRASR